MIDTITGMQSYLAALVNSTNDAVIGETLEGIVTSWNPAAQRLFEYAPSEMIGRSIGILFPASLQNEEMQLIGRIRSGEAVAHYETVRLTKSGKNLQISVTLSPIYGSGNELIGISKIARDITHERAHERAILLAMERQRLAADAGKVGLWTYSPATRKLEWNNWHKIMFGLPQDAETPSIEACLGFIHPDDQTRFQQALEEVAGNGSQLTIEYRILREDGTLRWISSNGHLRTDLADAGFFVLGTSIDLTERRASEEAMRRLNASMEEFACAAAHDLQEPLRNISLLLQELATSAGLTEEEKASFIEEAVRNANRLQTLISDLLSFSRAVETAGKITARASPHAALAAVRQNLARAIEETEASIIVDGTLPSIVMHQSHLIQLIQNLLGNSLKYRRPSVAPMIHISARVEKSQTVFAFSDNGVGIPLSQQAHIFGIFKRLDTSKPGNGIGLAVCKRIVEHYGGRIWIDSQPQPGATFLFSIPQTLKQELNLT